MELSAFVWAACFLQSVMALRTLDKIEDWEIEQGSVSGARIALVERNGDGTISVGLNVGESGKLVTIAPDPAKEGKFLVKPDADVTLINWGSDADFYYDKEELVAFVELLASKEAPKVKPQPRPVKKLFPKKKHERKPNPFTPTKGDRFRALNT